MRQAILITAYKDLDFLTQIIQYFDQDFEIFIHIDKKCKESYANLLHYPNVHIFHKYKIEWGGENHLKAILLLLREAAKNSHLEYFHLITGSDYPIRSLQQFKDFFEKHRKENYLEYFKLPRKDWGTEGGLERIKYFWLRPNMTRSKGAKLVRLLIRLQKKVGIFRPFSFFNGNLFGGGTYWSVSRMAIDNLLSFIDYNSSYMRRFRWTSIAEEICFPTIWLNSGLSFVNNSLRYIDWGPDGANPKILTENDFDSIVTSDAFFARKCCSPNSERLITLIKNETRYAL